MITTRQIERLWMAKSHEKLFRELAAVRPEGSLRLELELSGKLPAAALAVIRLDELNQSHVPLSGQLVHTILAGQEADGGWADPMTTAICLRALLAAAGEGIAIDRGLFYLANLQKTEGIWPNVPLRRMPADPHVSAFILLQLGDSRRFRQSVRFFDALNWFDANEKHLDAETRRLWDHASARCRLRNPATCDDSGRPKAAQALLWS